MGYGLRMIGSALRGGGDAAVWHEEAQRKRAEEEFKKLQRARQQKDWGQEDEAEAALATVRQTEDTWGPDYQGKGIPEGMPMRDDEGNTMPGVVQKNRARSAVLAEQAAKLGGVKGLKNLERSVTLGKAAEEARGQERTAATQARQESILDKYRNEFLAAEKDPHGYWANTAVPGYNGSVMDNHDVVTTPLEDGTVAAMRINRMTGERQQVILDPRQLAELNKASIMHRMLAEMGMASHEDAFKMAQHALENRKVSAQELTAQGNYAHAMGQAQDLRAKTLAGYWPQHLANETTRAAADRTRAGAAVTTAGAAAKNADTHATTGRMGVPQQRVRADGTPVTIIPVLGSDGKITWTESEEPAGLSRPKEDIQSVARAQFLAAAKEDPTLITNPDRGREVMDGIMQRLDPTYVPPWVAALQGGRPSERGKGTDKKGTQAQPPAAAAPAAPAPKAPPPEKLYVREKKSGRGGGYTYREPRRGEHGMAKPMSEWKKTQE